MPPQPRPSPPRDTGWATVPAELHGSDGTCTQEAYLLKFLHQNPDRARRTNPRGGPIQSTQIQQISYRTRSATFMYTWRHFKKWRPQSLQQKVLSGVNPMRFKCTERQMWKHAEVEDFERHALALKETRSCPQVATWLQETKRIFQLS